MQLSLHGIELRPCIGGAIVHLPISFRVDGVELDVRHHIVQEVTNLQSVSEKLHCILIEFTIPDVRATGRLPSQTKRGGHREMSSKGRYRGSA